MSEDCQEPVQKPVSNEVEETNGKQTSEEETRLGTAESLLSQEAARREKRLGLQQEAARREKRLGLQQSYPFIWIGDLFLANFKVGIEIRYVHGDVTIFKNALPTCTFPYPGIHVRKKLKFDDVSQRNLEQKIQTEKGSCVVIALPQDGKAEHWKCLQNQFIYYFNRKKIVGISEFPQDGKPEVGPVFDECEKTEKTADKRSSETETSASRADEELTSQRTKYEMFLFPPSQFVQRNLLPVAPKLTELLYKDQIPHLMLVIS